MDQITEFRDIFAHDDSYDGHEVYTYRTHSGAVMSLVIVCDGLYRDPSAWAATGKRNAQAQIEIRVRLMPI